MDSAAIFVLLLAFAINVPLGLWRVRLRRWTLLWFVACDGSVPVLWATRHALDAEPWVIPFEIGLALLANLGAPIVERRVRARAAVPASSA